MKKLLVAIALVGSAAIYSTGQTKDTGNKAAPDKTVKDAAIPTISIKPDSSPMDLAKIALRAHGGDSFKNMKTLVIHGTAEVSGSPTQTIPATFDFVFKGEKYRIDIANPMQPLKQIYDGDQTYSSMPNFSFPPLNRIGLALLPKIEEKGYMVAALPADKKKKLSFRITSPEGYYTDFFLNEKTGQVKSYESSFDVNGRTVTTAVDIDKVRLVEGVYVPEKYSQRFELGSLTIYSAFKASEIRVNSAVADDVFAIPK
jgi:hypothetical protein